MFKYLELADPAAHPKLTQVPKERQFKTKSWPIPQVVGGLIGFLITYVPTYLPLFNAFGLQALGALLGVALIAFSLFGDLPPWISWITRLGLWLLPGITIGTVTILLPLLPPQARHESSIFAFSPWVWLAYISIVLVSVSFEVSALPDSVYHFCKSLKAGPAIVIPVYIFITGLLGNIFDGVSIIAISIVIFRALLPFKWALRAAFALLFGGLISNLITVAGEPTNIKFQDVLKTSLDRVEPSFWLTNWPISVLGILLPTAYLACNMTRERVDWKHNAIADKVVSSQLHHVVDADNEAAPKSRWDVGLSSVVLSLLGLGIIVHAIMHQVSPGDGEVWRELWVFLLPAGLAALAHLVTVKRFHSLWTYLEKQWHVWGRLMVIFSLLWFLSHGLTQKTNVFLAFFDWPEGLRYAAMVVLALGSSITDNVALAAMQGQLILAHPIAVWQVRLLLILFTWSGGFTPFGCLQSLALNNNLNLSTGDWFRQTFKWSLISIVGGLAGLVLIGFLYPNVAFIPK